MPTATHATLPPSAAAEPGPVSVALPATARTDHQVRRLSAILSAAEDVFLEKGFERGSLDDVARKAGASKATIYSHFGDKVGLFKAIMGNRTDVISMPIKQAEITHASADVVLRSFGTNFLQILMSPLALNFYKLIIGHGADFPELGRTWFENGPRTIIKTLAEFLRARTDEGELDVADPESAAEMFLMSLRGTLHLQALLSMVAPPFDQHIAAKVDAGVNMFMNAHKGRSGSRKE